jgi:hypothetical protein
MEDEKNLNVENLNQDTTETKQPEATTETDKPGSPNHLRKLLEAEKKAKQKLKDELEAIKQLEADKQKSVEEKLLEARKENENLLLQSKKEKALSTLERKLLTERVNTEFSDLILSKAEKLIDLDLNNLDEIVDQLKTDYPSAFSIPEAKPLGQVGISATTSNNSFSMTKEQYLKLMNDETKPLTPEIKKLADENGW